MSDKERAVISPCCATTMKCRGRGLMVAGWLALLLSLGSCGGGKAKPAQEATCMEACEHVTELAEVMVAELQASGGKVTRKEEDLLRACVKKCESGQLIAECAVASRDLFTANVCSKKVGEKVDRNGVLLLVAASNGDAAVLQTLLKKGADVNYNRHGDTALGAAIVNGNVEVSRLLVAAKANVNFVTERTRVSLLQRAVIHERTKIVSILLAAGANVAHQDEAGTSAVQNAADLPEILKLLTEHGAK